MWLVTLSTVVGIATGMFTLRDQVFPGEAGSAGASDENAFRVDVGEICTEVNDAEVARRRDDRRLATALAAARDTLAQRDALLDAARASAARASHALAGFTALRAPKADSAGQRATAATWRSNLDRVQSYVERLDRVGDRPELLATVDWLSHDRSALARNGVQINAGLKQLGEDRCAIDMPRVPRTITLPADPRASRHRRRPRPHPTSTATPRATAPATATATATRATSTATPRPTPVATRSPVAHPRVNTPTSNGPVSGGGEDG